MRLILMNEMNMAYALVSLEMIVHRVEWKLQCIDPLQL